MVSLVVAVACCRLLFWCSLWLLLAVVVFAVCCWHGYWSSVDYDCSSGGVLLWLLVFVVECG